MFKVGEEFTVVSGFDQGDHNFEHGSVVRIVELCEDGVHVYKNQFGVEQWLTKDQVQRMDKNTASEWTDKHYDNKYQLSEEDIKNGFINLDVYFVSKQWRIGSRDESGALWHCLKTIARFGDKNSKEREIKALYAQIKCLAKLEGVDLD